MYHALPLAPICFLNLVQSHQPSKLSLLGRTYAVLPVICYQRHFQEFSLVQTQSSWSSSLDTWRKSRRGIRRPRLASAALDLGSDQPRRSSSSPTFSPTDQIGDPGRPGFRLRQIARCCLVDANVAVRRNPRTVTCTWHMLSEKEQYRIRTLNVAETRSQGRTAYTVHRCGEAA